MGSEGVTWAVQLSQRLERLAGTGGMNAALQ